MFKVGDLEKVVTELKKRQIVNVSIYKDEHQLTFDFSNGESSIILTEDWKKGEIQMHRAPQITETKKL